jgi:tetratricopeptide (TPR) repeat protein
MTRPLSRAFYISALLAAVGIPLCAVLVIAQGQRRGAAAAAAPAAPATPFQIATRAYIEGRYAEVDTLADKLDTKDPNVVALKARAAIARGLYADAEAALQAAAMRAPSSEAALELGLLQKLLSRPAANTTLSRVAELAETTRNGAELARAGRALQALGQFQDANAAFRDAAAAAPANAAIQTAWGDLFLEKYNKADAVKSYQDALQADPRWAPALVGGARALEDDNPPQAAALIKRALEINPNSVDAHVFLANQAVDADHRAEARELLTKAAAINPSSLDVHSMLAALAAVEDKKQEFDSEVAKVLAVSPGHGEVYRVAGEMVARNYRFEEAVTLTRQALALRPNDARALADLGAQLLRTGDEAEARTALEASFKIDAFDAVTLNALRLLDSLDKFETIRDGDLILKLSKDEAPVMKEYVTALAHEALATMAKRYEFTPKGPILIEMFPKHDDFAVRTVGLPGMIGALGACFGRVVTLDSPKARPPGEFLWEATLWHELGHVITLQMSNQRVPRWLTEGISEYEERHAHREWARQMDFMYAGLLNRGETIKLKDLNAAFQDPKLISIAYYEASLVVDHLVATFGQSGLNKLVKAYARGVDTDRALKEELNTDFDQLQIGFDQYVERAFGSLQKSLAVPKDVQLSRTPIDELRTLARENPRSYPVQMAYAAALRKAGTADEAIQVLERASALAPGAIGDDSPHSQLAEIALEKKDRARAIAELTALLDVDFQNVEAAHHLAALLREAGVTDPAKLRPVYERIVALDPFDGEARTALGRMALQRNDAEFAAREFRTVIALKPIDPAVAHTDLAESYLKAGKRAEAKRQTLAALEIAPTYERAQDLLLKLAEARP